MLFSSHHLPLINFPCIQNGNAVTLDAQSVGLVAQLLKHLKVEPLNASIKIFVFGSLIFLLVIFIMPGPFSDTNFALKEKDSEGSRLEKGLSSCLSPFHTQPRYECVYVPGTTTLPIWIGLCRNALVRMHTHSTQFYINLTVLIVFPTI